MSYFIGFCTGVAAVILALIVIEAIRAYDDNTDEDWF